MRLPFEKVHGYDAGAYCRELVRAAESIVSPPGLWREDIRRYLRDTEDSTIVAYE